MTIKLSIDILCIQYSHFENNISTAASQKTKTPTLFDPFFSRSKSKKLGNLARLNIKIQIGKKTFQIGRQFFNEEKIND